MFLLSSIAGIAEEEGSGRMGNGIKPQRGVDLSPIHYMLVPPTKDLSLVRAQ